MTPSKLAAKELEELLMASATRSKHLTMCRYGVQASLMDGKWTPVSSLPDFEGVKMGGGQFIIEAKVCAGPSFEMRKDKIKPRQVSHMLERSRFGVPCWVVIHFVERRLVNRFDPGVTVAIPVHYSNPMWQRFVDAYSVARRTQMPVEPQGSISRSAAIDMGRLVLWTAPKGSRKFLPDLDRLLEIQTEPELF